MKTTSFTDLTVHAAATVNAAAQPDQTGPIELDLNTLQFVAGGLTPRGGWSAEPQVVVVDTAYTPRGGW